MLLSIIFIGISSSIDALCAGLAYGLRNTKIPLISKLVICFFSILYASIAQVLGKYLSGVLNPFTANIIGISILFIIGSWVIIQGITQKSGNDVPLESFSTSKTLLKIVIKSLGITIHVIKNPQASDLDKSGSIEPLEAILLGFALSIDAVGTSLGSAMSGLYSLGIPMIIGVFQVILLHIGTRLGGKFKKCEKINQKILSVMAGVLLLVLGLIRAFTVFE